jgi:dipeptidyl aminopeptidase/acylaminoacyl peptidase
MTSSSGTGRRATARVSMACAVLALLGPATSALAQTPAPLTLEQAMALAKPESFGAAVFSAWWTADGRQLIYQQLRGGTLESYSYNPADGSTRLLDSAAAAQVDPEERSLDAAGRRIVFAREGIVLRELPDGEGRRLTSDAQDRDPRFSADGRQVFFRRGADWWAVPAGGKVAAKPVLQARGELPPPANRPGANDASAAVYLDPQVVVRDSWLSPDGRHAVVATTPKGYDAGRVAQMPKYITASGYPEMEDLLPYMGRNPEPPQALWLIDVAGRRAQQVNVATLTGIATDPFADLRAAQKLPALAGLRPFAVAAAQWSPDSRQVVVQIATPDRRDIWLAAVDADSGKLTQRHHQVGLALIPAGFGFAPDGRLWFQSEAGGYFGLHLNDGRNTRAVVNGPFEVGFDSVRWSPDGRRAYFPCNRRQPTHWEVCRVDADGSDLRELTAFDGGVGSQLFFDVIRVSPDGRQLAVRHSAPLLPLQLSLVDAETGATRRLTDTRGEAMKTQAAQLVEPRFVAIPSRHFKGQIWAKLHRPDTLDPARRYPLVLILHGGNTVQGASRRVASPREALFAQFLVAQGYQVLEIDYRGSIGYGRDFREAVYRRLGLAEVEDFRDAVDYMVAQHQVSRDQVGAYGCSYGGYLAYMAAFLAPDVFKAVASASGWSDLAATNNSNPTIFLDTPVLNPDAFAASSATTHAHKLATQLLILHPMDDRAVPYEHAVRAVAKLLDAGKQSWDFVTYPTGEHCFSDRPDYGTDAYRRSFQMFERHLKPAGNK